MAINMYGYQSSSWIWLSEILYVHKLLAARLLLVKSPKSEKKKKGKGSSAVMCVIARMVFFFSDIYPSEAFSPFCTMSAQSPKDRAPQRPSPTGQTSGLDMEFRIFHHDEDKNSRPPQTLIPAACLPALSLSLSAKQSTPPGLAPVSVEPISGKAHHQARYGRSPPRLFASCRTKPSTQNLI